MRMSGDRLNGLDAAFLKLDTLASPMNIGALAVFDAARPVVVADLVGLLAERLGPVERFRMRPRRVSFPPGAVRWERDPRFQVDAHIRVGCLPAPGNRDQLADYVAQAVARQLDLTRPLWEVHLIIGLADGNFALLAKTQHALADGMGIAHLIAAIVDDPPTLPEPDNQVAGGVGLTEALRAVRRPDQWLTAPTRLANQVATRVTESGRQAVRGLGIAASVVRRARVAPSSPLLGPPGRVSLRRALHTARLDRPSLGLICQTHQVTTNDVVLAVLSGVLRRWLTHRGHPVDELSLRALVPVDLRAHNQNAVPGEGNELSGYLCPLPVAEPDPLRRLDLVHTAMERNKAAGPYRGPGAVAFLAGTLPGLVRTVATPLAGQRAGLLFDVLVTSGTLPAGQWPVAGSPMKENFGVAPLASGHGLSVAVSKTRQFVGLTLYSDPSIVPDAAVLRDAVPPSLAELRPAVPIQRAAATDAPAAAAPAARRDKPTASANRRAPAKTSRDTNPKS